MKRVGVFGSCLAGLTAAMLAGDFGWVRQNNVIVNRSDIFVKYFINRERFPSRQLVERILSIKPEFLEVANPILVNMFVETLGITDLPSGTKPLLYNVRDTRFDVFLLDNLHDTQLPKHTYRSIDGRLDFELNFPLDWCDLSSSAKTYFELSPRLGASESAQNWAAIARYLRSVQPAAHIVFLCASSSTFRNDDDRRARADAFEAELRAAVRGTDIEIIPPLHIPLELSKLPYDQDHFDMKVYRALAGRVFTSLLLAPPVGEVHLKGASNAG